MLRLLAILFVVSVFIPVEFYTMAGSVRIEPYRIVLGIALLHTLLNFKAMLERADIVDVCLIGLLVLAFASIWHNHDLQQAVESSGIYAIETLGAFFLARMYITTPERFYQINQMFIVTLASLTLFAAYEAFAQHRFLHEIAKQITGHDALDFRLYMHYYIRNGVMRATSLFEHPILYGSLLALCFPFAFMLLRRTRSMVAGVNVIALIVSMLLTLSSAPLLSLIFQSVIAVLVKFWNSARRLWIALLFAGLSVSLLINAFSNRGFFGILISYLTFNPNTGYFRMLQWEYSMDDIAENPIFGIGLIGPGLHDWTRPYWIASWFGNSIDSFWLLLTLQHGLFAAALLLFASLYASFNALNLLHKHGDTTRWMVAAWVMSFFSLILIGFTVDYFGKLQPMFFFTLGAISWAKDYPIWNRQAEELETEQAIADTDTDITRKDGD
ncbi:MAG: O-antigen ligase family protein [Thiothrix sp.]|uniref:O-antigen ligase family protein n=1 Tax=Thiothrix sp. TaxID=1032 RepID=UPI0026192574|nr:O-antigen ligase family protein [Thiothrix sp.]MDD5392006.1 O-antigen ligase family protein [Thiothrix sp.]